MGDTTPSPNLNAHVISELGMSVTRVGDELRGRAAVVPEMYVPGTECLRTSIIATWADLFAGLLAGTVFAPRVSVTLELSVDLYTPPIGGAALHAVGRVLKAGKSVTVASVDFTAADDEPIAMATASFMASPDATLPMPSLAESLSVNHPGGGRLAAPFAERAHCRRREPGVAALARSADGLNSSNTINGGLIALAVEEAALSLTPGATLSSLAMRYMRPARVGPLVASATAHGDLARVDVRDAGSDERLVVIVTTRAHQLVSA